MIAKATKSCGIHLDNMGLIISWFDTIIGALHIKVHYVVIQRIGPRRTRYLLPLAAIGAELVCCLIASALIAAVSTRLILIGCDRHLPAIHHRVGAIDVVG